MKGDRPTVEVTGDGGALVGRGGCECWRVHLKEKIRSRVRVNQNTTTTQSGTDSGGEVRESESHANRVFGLAS